MLKNKIFQYFFLEFFKIFLLVSLSLSLLIWMTQAARLLELITEFGNPVNIYIKYLILSYPKILENTFLLSFLISMFFFIAKLDTSNELGIYWLSGISKFQIVKVTIYISTFVLLLNLSLSVFFAPWASGKGRLILGESKFSLINSLVKEKNFNSPLKGLTLYVDKNDQNGNLEGIFIYEKTRTIIAKKGRVLKDENGSYLELIRGTTQEKIGDKINFINFNSTIFDFSKYQLQNVGVLKFNERNILWLFDQLTKNKISKINEIREEINKRLLKPFFIFIACIMSCFLLYTNNEKINLKKFRLCIYSFSIIVLILNQALLGLSGKNIYHSFGYAVILLLMFLVMTIFLYQFLKSEAK